MTASSPSYQVALRSQQEAGQWNLFTGELEVLPAENGETVETGWLFDPEWHMVLPENPAGQEILVDEGLSIAFPDGAAAAPKEPLVFGVQPKLSRETPSVAKTPDSAQVILSGFGIYL